MAHLSGLTSLGSGVTVSEELERVLAKRQATRGVKAVLEGETLALAQHFHGVAAHGGVDTSSRLGSSSSAWSRDSSGKWVGPSGHSSSARSTVSSNSARVVLLHYSPDGATTEQRMVSASSKSALTAKLPDSAELVFASSPEEFSDKLDALVRGTATSAGTDCRSEYERQRDEDDKHVERMKKATPHQASFLTQMHAAAAVGQIRAGADLRSQIDAFNAKVKSGEVDVESTAPSVDPKLLRPASSGSLSSARYTPSRGGVVTSSGNVSASIADRMRMFEQG
ncbi:MAG: hypothetical protein MHM6MM_004402 [Cercozoa sp. M6MM]